MVEDSKTSEICITHDGSISQEVNASLTTFNKKKKNFV